MGKRATTMVTELVRDNRKIVERMTKGEIDRLIELIKVNRVCVNRYKDQVKINKAVINRDIDQVNVNKAGINKDIDLVKINKAVSIGI